MAEKKEMHIENLKVINELLSSGKLNTLLADFNELEKKVKSSKGGLEQKLASLIESEKNVPETQEKVEVQPVQEVNEVVETIEVVEVKEETKEIHDEQVEEKAETEPI